MAGPEGRPGGGQPADQRPDVLDTIRGLDYEVATRGFRNWLEGTTETRRQVLQRLGLVVGAVAGAIYLPNAQHGGEYGPVSTAEPTKTPTDQATATGTATPEGTPTPEAAIERLALRETDIIFIGGIGPDTLWGTPENIFGTDRSQWTVPYGGTYTEEDTGHEGIAAHSFATPYGEGLVLNSQFTIEDDRQVAKGEELPWERTVVIDEDELGSDVTAISTGEPMGLAPIDGGFNMRPDQEVRQRLIVDPQHPYGGKSRVLITSSLGYDENGNDLEHWELVFDLENGTFNYTHIYRNGGPSAPEEKHTYDLGTYAGQLEVELHYQGYNRLGIYKVARSGEKEELVRLYDDNLPTPFKSPGRSLSVVSYDRATTVLRHAEVRLSPLPKAVELNNMPEENRVNSGLAHVTGANIEIFDYSALFGSHMRRFYMSGLSPSSPRAGEASAISMHDSFAFYLYNLLGDDYRINPWSKYLITVLARKFGVSYIPIPLTRTQQGIRTFKPHEQERFIEDMTALAPDAITAPEIHNLEGQIDFADSARPSRLRQRPDWKDILADEIMREAGAITLPTGMMPDRIPWSDLARYNGNRVTTTIIIDPSTCKNKEELSAVVDRLMHGTDDTGEPLRYNVVLRAVHEPTNGTPASRPNMEIPTFVIDHRTGLLRDAKHGTLYLAPGIPFRPPAVTGQVAGPAKVNVEATVHWPRGGLYDVLRQRFGARDSISIEEIAEVGEQYGVLAYLLRPLSWPEEDVYVLDPVSKRLKPNHGGADIYGRFRSALLRSRFPWRNFVRRIITTFAKKGV